MKEAIGTSMVFNLIIIFIIVFIVILVGSLAFSKGFKVRDRIIDIIEKHEGYTDSSKTEIDENLASIGYQIELNQQCKEKNGKQPLSNNSGFRYCVYQYDTNKGDYYGVTVFVHFDFPLIGSFIELPLYGETRIIFDKKDVEG